MGFRFSKRIKLAKGVNLNFSKSGIGISAGVKGARIGTGPKGTKATFSVPGTGISYSKNIGRNNNVYNNDFENKREKSPLEKKIESFILKILVFALGILTSFLTLVFLLMIFDKFLLSLNFFKIIANFAVLIIMSTPFKFSVYFNTVYDIF